MFGKMSLKSLEDKIRSTLKSDETESRFEIYFTRSFGYLWALFFKKLHVHPNVVTIVSIVLGSVAGVFFYYDDWRLNLIGIFLLIWANWYDCADGQLARMTGQKTLLGRILDGFAGDVWFFIIYLSLSLRYREEWGIWIWLLALIAGLSHGKQCLLADYYRNIHLLFYKGTACSELDTFSDVRAKMRALSWKTDWFQKIYLYFYGNYVYEQEKLTPSFQQLRSFLLHNGFGGILPESQVKKFRSADRPLIRIANIITFDTRFIFLCIVLLCGVPWLYLVFELTVMNILFLYMRYAHERLCRMIKKDLEQKSTIL